MGKILAGEIKQPKTYTLNIYIKKYHEVKLSSTLGSEPKDVDDNFLLSS